MGEVTGKVRGCGRGGDGRAEAAVFAAHSGFIFLFPFPSPICALHEADRLNQREGEGEGLPPCSAPPEIRLVPSRLLTPSELPSRRAF